MQMTISTTGRRLLCILCFVFVLSKMLKLCGAEGSSFRWFVGAVSCFCWDPSLFEVDLVAEQRLCGGAPDLSVMMLLSDFDWCFQLLRSIRLLFLRLTSFWSSILDTVNCLLLKQHLYNSLGVRSLDAVNFFCWISVLVFSSDSWIVGFRPSFWEWMPFVEIHQILFLKWISLQCWVFWDETCQMVSLQWVEPFDEGQWLVVSDRCLIAFSFCRDPSDFLVSEVDLFAVEIYQTLFLR